MKTRIISAFPGTGKTYYHISNRENTLDSDSSNFSWIKDEKGKNTDKRNPEFPKNYMENIKSNIGKYDFIFVSSHKEVRDALRENGIPYYLIYPPTEKKDQFMKRYVDRGSSKEFISLMDSNWEKWISEIDQEEEKGYTKIKMTLNSIEDELNYILISEGNFNFNFKYN